MSPLLESLRVPRNEIHRLVRIATVMDIVQGRSEDETYRRRIDSMIRCAREEGCNESDAEVIASYTRQFVAETLTELRNAGHLPAAS